MNSSLFVVLYYIVLILYLIASIQTIRVYFTLKLEKYLNFSIIFFLIALDFWLIFLGFFDTIIETLVFFTFIYLFQNILSELDDKKSILFVSNWKSIFLSLATIATLSHLINQISIVIQYIRLLITDFALIGMGIALVAVLSDPDQALRTRKIDYALLMWKILGITTIAIGLIRGGTFSLAILGELTGVTAITSSVTDLISLTEYVVLFGYGLFSLLLLAIVLLIPEALFLTEAYRMNLEDLYEIVSHIENLKISNDTSLLNTSSDAVVEYLREIKELNKDEWNVSKK